MDQPVAIFFQARPAPEVDGQKKPFKRGGYSDSGADIAYTLRQLGIPVVTPVDSPDAHANLEWVFPDDEAGIQAAYARRARTFWANTVLYRGHPFDRTTFPDVCIVGQEPSVFERIDDKFKTNELLRAHGASPIQQVAVAFDGKKVLVADAAAPTPRKVTPRRSSSTGKAARGHHGEAKPS